MERAADAAAHYTPVRRELVGHAYRMTGSVATAEDIAQEVFLRWNAADRARVEVPRAWMLKAAARLCLDHLKSARVRRERYVGPWLPEPVLDSGDAPQHAAHLRAEDVSVAFLLTLQRLSPAERAAFILHDLFDTPFAEIAALLGRTEPGCRQLAARARARLGRDAAPRSGPPVDEAEAQRIARAFHAASRSGDEAALRDLLAHDAVLHTDSGGARPAALRPILGAERIGRFFAGVVRKSGSPAPPTPHPARINGLPGYVTLERDGLPQTTALELRGGLIAAIYVVRNPAKLAAVRTALGGRTASG